MDNIGPRTNLKKKSNSLPNCHWNTKRKGPNRKQKQIYETLDEANEFIEKHSLKDVVAYQCPYCCKWHIGHINIEKKRENIF